MTQAIQVSSPFLTYEIVRLGVDGIGRVAARERDRIVEQCLAAADALPLASQSYATLSGGEQRREELAPAPAPNQDRPTRAQCPSLLFLQPGRRIDPTQLRA